MGFKNFTVGQPRALSDQYVNVEIGNSAINIYRYEGESYEGFVRRATDIAGKQAQEKSTRLGIPINVDFYERSY